MVPTTLSELRAFCGEPTCPRDACSICSTIPDYCHKFVKGDTISYDTVPWAAVQQLVPFIGEIENSSGEVKRCPECKRMYAHQSDYDPMPPAFWVDDEEETTDTIRRREVEELFRSPWFSCLRILRDSRFSGRQTINVEDQQFFRRHVFAEVGFVDKQWVVLFDEQPLEVVDGRLAVLTRVASSERPEGLGERDRAIEYATFADRVTSEYKRGFSYVDAFDSIPWRRELASEDRAQIEDVRAASRVEPMHVGPQADAWLIRRWVIAQQRLICRLLTVLPTGEVRREDAVVGENLPVDLK
ncbi:MAG: hypothetical protein ABI867_29605 [Kofleriaceae bacterium]